MSRAALWPLSAVLLMVCPAVLGGAYLASDNAAVPESSITHPKTFAGSGGTISNTVCLNTSILPSGVTAADVEKTVLKVLRSWNRMRGASRNLAIAFSNNDIANSAQIDYESTLLHEVGHCIGLAHPNLATESGLVDPQRNATKARSGVNASFDTDAGSDTLHGSADDLRGDDVNLYWFYPLNNDPLALPTVIDTSSFSRNVANLPAGSSWAANGDRSVLAALGYVSTESAMQQGQTNDEAQRRPTNEDIATLRMAMAGLDETQGTADDYTLSLTYGGQVTSNSCDINVTFENSSTFAFCSTSLGQFTSFPNHLVINAATIVMGTSTNWYFSPTENTSTTVSSTPATPQVGAVTALNVSVDRLSSAMIGTPSGSFEVSLGNQTCSGTLSAVDADTASGSCNITPSTGGSLTLKALYLGDLGFDASEVAQSVTVSSVSVTIDSDTPDPSAAGQAYTVVATVTGSGATPTGTVDISDGSANCTITLSAGTGSCGLTSTSPGAKTLTATYSGDGNYSTATDTEAHTVTQATPTVTITSDVPDPSFIGAAYTVSFTVSGNAGTPTGTVTVDDGAANCVATLTAGAGSCALTSSTTGNKILTANYPGNATYLAASDTESHTVTLRTPVLQFDSISPQPSLVGQDYSVTVSVSGAGSVPSGSVTLSEGGASCMATLSTGSANCSLNASTAGSKTLSFTYSGDGEYSAASSSTAHTVNPGAAAVSITSVVPTTVVIDTSYTVSVSVSGGGVSPGGSVLISEGSNNCSASLSSGSGSCALTSTTVGSKTLSASYPGDANYAAANASQALSVNKAAPNLRILSVAPNPVVSMGSYTVTVAVDSIGTAPSGDVSIGDGDSTCIATLVGLQTSCALTAGAAGSKTLSASYPGDSRYQADSASGSVEVSARIERIYLDGFEAIPPP